MGVDGGEWKGGQAPTKHVTNDDSVGVLRSDGMAATAYKEAQQRFVGLVNRNLTFFHCCRWRNDMSCRTWIRTPRRVERDRQKKTKKKTATTKKQQLSGVSCVDS